MLNNNNFWHKCLCVDLKRFVDDFFKHFNGVVWHYRPRDAEYVLFMDINDVVKHRGEDEGVFYEVRKFAWSNMFKEVKLIKKLHRLPLIYSFFKQFLTFFLKIFKLLVTTMHDNVTKLFEN